VAVDGITLDGAAGFFGRDQFGHARALGVEFAALQTLAQQVALELAARGPGEACRPQRPQSHRCLLIILFLERLNWAGAGVAAAG